MMKQLTNSTFLFLLTILLSIDLCAQSISQEYGVLKSTVMKMRYPVVDQSLQEKRILVHDKLTGKKATFNLQIDSSKKWYEGSYNINFVGNKYDFPILEYFNDGSNEKLFVVIEPTATTSEVALFLGANEATEYLKTKDLQLAKSGKTQDEMARIKDKSTGKEQLSFEALESIRQAELLKAQARMSEEEKQKRIQDAEALIAEADAKYAKGQYKEASALYQKATELDPANEKIYYKYGVSLYKIDEYSKSLSMLSMAEGGSQDRVEHNFYVALNKMKLKDFDRALEDFKDIREENDKELSPTASFMAGQIEFQKQKYADAKKSYEYVLDNSKDPAMDKEAERKIEEIDRIETYLASSKDIIRYSFNFGGDYDGNIVNVSQNNVPTDVAGFRFMYGASIWYALKQKMGTEWGLGLSYSDIYSLDKNFKSSSTLQSADPLVMGISLPYKTNFTMFKKAFMWTLTPSYNTTMMSAESNARTLILNTATIATDISFQLSPIWISAYRFSFDQDTSMLTTSTGDNNQNALRTTVGTTQTKIIDLKNNTFFATDFSYAMNNATGKNYTYNKAALGFSYIWPVVYSANGLGKFELTDLQYPQNASGRHDITAAVTVGASKSLSQEWAMTTSVQYSNNGSTVAADMYDKFLLLAMFSYSGKVSKK